MEMLSNNEHSDVVAWLHHGKAFRIYKRTRFVNEVFLKYFNESQFTSFTRKLNRWGFNRVRRGPETGAYYHIFFQQGNFNLCSKMVCSSMKLPSAKTHPKNKKESIVYTPPPEFSPSTAYTLKLAHEVQMNMILIDELTRTVSQKANNNHVTKASMEKNVKSAWPLVTSNLSTNNKSEVIPCVNLSQSSIQASINTLRKSIEVGSISGLKSNTEMLISLAGQLQRNMQHFISPNVKKNLPKQSKSSSAA